MRILDLVDRLYIINLPEKEDRRVRLIHHLDELGLAAGAEIHWSRAVRGHSCPAPAWFQAGDAAWGCLQSHARVVQDAAMDGIESYCVLEDDAVFHRQAGNLLKCISEEMPSDWGQIYLGGQHLQPPRAVPGKQHLWSCRNVNRTHAYLLHRRSFAKFQQHILHAPDYMANGSWHIDHQLGIAHERRDWPTYAAAWWLAGQEQGSSSISAKNTPRMWWHHEVYQGSLPFIVVTPDVDRGYLESVRRFIHFGHNLKMNTCEDVGLDACVESDQALLNWLSMISAEALAWGLLPAIQHPKIPLSRVQELWAAGAHRSDEIDLSSLTDYPFNGLFDYASKNSLLEQESHS